MHTDNKMPLSKRTAIGGILAAVSIALSFAESMIPSLPILPVGAKLGFSNIAIMVAVLTVGTADAFAITIIKSGFVLLTRGAVASFMSLSGGLLSFAVLASAVIITKKTKCGYSYIAVSVLCAAAHNIGQCTAASIYMGTNLFTSYISVLLIAGVFSGAVTGVVLHTVMPAISKATNKFNTRKNSTNTQQ